VTASENGSATAALRKAEVSAYGEIGASGLRVSGGRPQDEFHRNLRGDRAIRIYREMADNDAIVGAMLTAIDLTLRKVEWDAEPADETPEAQMGAEFLASCLGDLNVPWNQVVSAALSMLPYGWAFMETVYKIRGGDVEDPTRRSKYDDGLVGWRKHALRAQETRARWAFGPDGGLRGFVQADGSREVTIPIEKGLLFRTTSARSNPEGRSILRNAYRSWWMKKRIEELEGIGIERDLAGLPIALVPPEYLDDGASAEQKSVLEEIKKIVRDIKRDEQEGIIFPKQTDPDSGADLWELKLLTSGGRRQFDTDAIIARYDQRIAMTALADVILLGHEKVGSQALGSEKMALFHTALTAYADEIEDVMNEYAIPRLWRANGFPTATMPHLEHGDIEQVDLAALGEYIKAISGAGVVVDPTLDSYLRDVGGMPTPETEPTQV